MTSSDDDGVSVNVLPLMKTGKNHTGLCLVNRGMWKPVSASFGEELFYQLGSMCLCVVMQKIPVFTQPELRPPMTNRAPQTTSSRSVYLQRFVQVFDDNLFEHIQTPKHHSRLSVVGSLVVRASDSVPEGLGSMPVPPNILRVHTEYMFVKSVVPKVLWAESRVQGNGDNFPPSQFHA
ncbi:uncharacterized protein TNCV_914121 [Trichonephila clavipes]|nr:uncharacterized protein TNCV_914121 [Trichonephila clavipes]